MPSFYKVTGPHPRRPSSFQDRPVLNADQIEDVVAFLDDVAHAMILLPAPPAS